MNPPEDLCPPAASGSALTLLKTRNGAILETYTQWPVYTDGGNARALGVYIPADEGNLLFSLVRQLCPARTVEIGMANGLSTAFIADALRENGRGEHIAIDPFQHRDWGGAGIDLLRRAGLEPYVRVVEKCSHQALPELEQAGITAQFAFVDGSHLFDYVISDCLCVDRILDVGGLLAFDDSDWPAVTQAIRFMLANRNYEVAFPDVVIEGRAPTPTILGRVLRRFGRAFPRLGAKMRPDFMVPSEHLEIHGRCVVLRKLADDRRDSQSKFHQDF